MTALLVANRGEIAVRVLRAGQALHMRTIAVYAPDDEASLHVRLAEEAHVLPGEGVAAYLDASAVLAVAAATGATAIHPGYGFLSENAEFARACAAAGVTFVGPPPQLLALFGDKTAARELAAAAGVPVLPGTGATDVDGARRFAQRHGAVLLKAVAGGGGRGMRVVTDVADVADAFERCRSEAAQAFGNGDIYVERLLPTANHIEVQIVGDGAGVVHLGERDCGIQRRHQKLVEVAPSPSLRPDLRERLLAAAITLAERVGYASLGTFEFLVSGAEFWFIEANPRLQVEHTVTEEVTGVDLVRTQLRIAAGASLGELGLVDPPRPTGFAVQARVNTESVTADGTPRSHSGTLRAFSPPTGPGVRVDTHGYPGYRVGGRYDSLLAKIITRGVDFPDAVARLATALAECTVDGVATTIPLLRRIVADPDFVAGHWDTTFVTRFPDAATEPVSADPTVVRAPMPGTVIDIGVNEGDHVVAGARLLVLEAMKMEHAITAAVGGVITAIVPGKGDPVDEDAPLVYLAGDGSTATGGASTDTDRGWADEVAEIGRRRELATAMGGPDKVARQHREGRLTARERIDALVDEGSFAEIGTLTGFGEYGADGALTAILPANFITGTARIDGRRVVLGVDDFTVRGGSGDAAIHAKQIYSEHYAGQLRLPLIRLLDGQSGGGSVKMAQESGFTYVPVNPAWDAVVDNLSVVPVVAAGLGPTVGLGAGRLVMSHLAVLVTGVGQLFVAGPPVVRGATGEDLTKEQLGGADVHRRNGAVERFVATEQEAFEVIRRFLSYLPRNVYETPPTTTEAQPEGEHDLLTAIPRDPRRPYRIEPILAAIFDAGSVFRYADYGDATVTALARLAGHPVGVLATDPMKGATMSDVGAQAITRLVDLCQTFHLPVVSLTDQAGMTIGAAGERRGTIRHGARAISAVYQATVPQAELILRRVYGVGGAGIVNRHRAGRSWAWPSGDWGSLPVQGGVEAAFRAQIADAADQAAEIERLRALLAAITSPFRTAEHFGVQDLIDPRDSRALLCDWVVDAYRLLPELTGRPSFGARP